MLARGALCCQSDEVRVRIFFNHLKTLVNKPSPESQRCQNSKSAVEYLQLALKVYFHQLP